MLNCRTLTAQVVVCLSEVTMYASELLEDEALCGRVCLKFC